MRVVFFCMKPECTGYLKKSVFTPLIKHKVDCTNCLHVNTCYCEVDGLKFRINETCKLGHKTNYHIPLTEEYDCEHYTENTILNKIKYHIKKLIKR